MILFAKDELLLMGHQTLILGWILDMREQRISVAMYQQRRALMICALRLSRNGEIYTDPWKI